MITGLLAGAAGARVGVLWLAHREAGTPTEHAGIYDIAVDEARRGSGGGRKLLARAEEQTRALGLTSLRLNVFGENTVARNLYRSQGFTESRVTMIKDVRAEASGSADPRAPIPDTPGHRLRRWSAIDRFLKAAARLPNGLLRVSCSPGRPSRTVRFALD